MTFTPGRKIPISKSTRKDFSSHQCSINNTHSKQKKKFVSMEYHGEIALYGALIVFCLQGSQALLDFQEASQ